MKSIRYICEALVAYGFYAILCCLPASWASAMLGWLAVKMGPFFKAHRIAKQNLQRVFPEKTEADIREILRKMWNNLGRTVGEFPFMASCSEKEFYEKVTIENEDYLKQYFKKGQPVIFFSAHLGNWELAPKTAAIYGQPLALVYRPSNNPLVEKLVHHVRRHYQSEAIPKGLSGARDVMRCLKQGKSVGMLLDQKMNDGIAVPFMGRDAMTAPAVASLAKKFKCPVIPAQVIRLDGVRFKVVIHPPLFATESGDSKEDTYQFMLRINQLMESWVREHPEQWFWVHNRWPKDQATLEVLTV